jgi:phosphoribosyl-AMP cyclohydrolase
VPAIVQDAATGAVLMLAYMDREALDATLRTREVHFHSRSRGMLWRKGETSGNVLHLVELVPDCDSDALLVKVHPAGPVCHTGQATCFGPVNETDLGHFLSELAALLRAAAIFPPAPTRRSSSEAEPMRSRPSSTKRRKRPRPRFVERAANGRSVS